MHKSEQNGFGSRLMAIMISLIFAAVIAVGCNSDDKDQKIVLINLGDSYANGVQSGRGNINQYTQVHSYAQVIADQMKESANLIWNNPLLDMKKKRLDNTVIPYNVSVDGATAQSLLKETTDENQYMKELLQPIPEKIGSAITQLEAAEYVAGLHDDDDIKIITLLIGGNDFMGIVNAGGGTELTAMHINAFLSDKNINGEPLNKGRDLNSVKQNLTTIVNRLKAIPNSHIFIGNLPSVTNIAGLFNAQDIERLAVYDNPYVNALQDGEHIGFAPVGGFGVLPGLGGALAADDATLNATIQGTLKAGGNDAFSITRDEIALIDQQLSAVNDHIARLADESSNVYMVDLIASLNSLKDGKIKIGKDTIGRGYGAGFFSLDGFHPSHTGYALIADEFIKKINDSYILDPIPGVDLEAIWKTDPYRDNDGDGYVPGPADLSIINPMFISYLDCDDNDSTVYAPFPTAGMTGTCQ
ncbi:MAG: hypothetical protein HQK61_02525 [Desulfamplus sp.]|nr:hypothetical protein [Desulfamplus sp.]